MGIDTGRFRCGQGRSEKDVTVLASGQDGSVNHQSLEPDETGHPAQAVIERVRHGER